MPSAPGDAPGRPATMTAWVTRSVGRSSAPSLPSSCSGPSHRRAARRQPPGRAAQAAPGDPVELAELREVALSDVVTVAVRQSPDLARARIDVTSARAQVTRAEGSQDTHLGAQAQVNRYSHGATDPALDS